ncbi:MAG: hypothetical protein UZ22_OP11002000546 [Microgenomates bacterium OLB23]|nr:MAG: hypothetical protein UZ22_OP11002000546 [Microgenomates bacterium OLB23]
MYTIAICCSKKFKKEERLFSRKLKKLGINVYASPLHASRVWESLEEADKVAFAAGATYRHFHKIRKSDAIFVLNVKGYIGVSTNLEIGFAAALDKRIFFMEDDIDYPRKILIDGFAKTPEELIRRIKDVKTPDVLDR